MKTNIFFFISNFNFGGAGNAIFTFLNNLDRKKFDLHIFFLGNSEYEKILPKYVKYYKLRVNYNVFKTFFCFFEIKKILNEQSKDFKKNIFISNIHYSNVLSIIFLKKIKNLKLILFERTSVKELDIYENIFSYKGEKSHEYVSLYMVEFEDQSVYDMKEIVGNEGPFRQFIASWIPINKFLNNEEIIFPEQTLIHLKNV